jgi:hypothetical protein
MHQACFRYRRLVERRNRSWYSIKSKRGRLLARIHILVCPNAQESCSLWYDLPNSRQYCIEPQLTGHFLGIPREILQDDPQLGGRRMELAITAARKLSAARMITYNERTEELIINDLGLIAAKYYIRHASIEVYNEASAGFITSLWGLPQPFV